MLQISIGLSSLQTAQQGLAIAGNNLANAATPGYHRQIARVATLNSTTDAGLSVGTGVGIAEVNRAVNEQLDSALTQQTSLNASTDASLTTSTQIEQTISSGTTSPSTLLESFLNKLQSLSANPSDRASRQSVVLSAASVASAFNTASSDLTKIQKGLDQSIHGDVSQINSLASQIASLNGQISVAASQGITVNNLLDQRGQLINNLAKLVNVQVQDGNNGQLTVTASGVPLAIGTLSQTLQASTDKTGAAIVTVAGSDATLSFNSGDLGGLLSQRNGTLVDVQSRIDTLAKQVAISFNAIQSTGLGGSGGFTNLTGQNGVTSTTANLNAAGLTFPAQAGSLFIGVTNTATGQRTITSIPIDPQSQSLQDVANAIGSTVPNLNAFVNGQTGTLSLISATGYTFDFTGGFSSNPTTTFVAGGSPTATIGGAYTGTTNDTYSLVFNAPAGTGTIGSTPNLDAQIVNSAGQVVGTVNVGQGYQPGQPINLANGVKITLSAGNVTTGDSISTSVIGNPDSANLLTALGLNSLFTGRDAASFAVSANVLADPKLLATSRTGQPGDSSNLQRFAALADAQVLNNGTQSFSQYSYTLVSDIGTSVSALTQQQSTNQTLTTSITNQQQSVSGVDTNQELSSVLQYQQQFALAGKYISAVNSAINQLIADL